MPRHEGCAGKTLRTRRSSGYPRRGNGIGSYSRKRKALKADRYDRPYLTGDYSRKG